MILLRFRVSHPVKKINHSRTIFTYEYIDLCEKKNTIVIELIVKSFVFVYKRRINDSDILTIQNRSEKQLQEPRRQMADVK